MPGGSQVWTDGEPLDLWQSQTRNIISLRMHLKLLSQWVKEAEKGHKQERGESLLEFCRNSPAVHILWPVSMFAIRKEARKSPFPSFKFICPKHPLRAGPRPKRPGQVCRPHVNGSVIMEQWETHVYYRQAQ